MDTPNIFGVSDSGLNKKNHHELLQWLHKRVKKFKNHPDSVEKIITKYLDIANCLPWKKFDTDPTVLYHPEAIATAKIAEAKTMTDMSSINQALFFCEVTGANVMFCYEPEQLEIIRTELTPVIKNALQRQRHRDLEAAAASRILEERATKLRADSRDPQHSQDPGKTLVPETQEREDQTRDHTADETVAETQQPEKPFSEVLAESVAGMKAAQSLDEVMRIAKDTVTVMKHASPTPSDAELLEFLKWYARRRECHRLNGIQGGFDQEHYNALVKVVTPTLEKAKTFDELDEAWKYSPVHTGNVKNRTMEAVQIQLLAHRLVPFLRKLITAETSEAQAEVQDQPQKAADGGHDRDADDGDQPGEAADEDMGLDFSSCPWDRQDPIAANDAVTKLMRWYDNLWKSAETLQDAKGIFLHFTDLKLTSKATLPDAASGHFVTSFFRNTLNIENSMIESDDPSVETDGEHFISVLTSMCMEEVDFAKLFDKLFDGIRRGSKISINTQVLNNLVRLLITMFSCARWARLNFVPPIKVRVEPTYFVHMGFVRLVFAGKIRLAKNLSQLGMVFNQLGEFYRDEPKDVDMYCMRDIIRYYIKKGFEMTIPDDCQAKTVSFEKEKISKLAKTIENMDDSAKLIDIHSKLFVMQPITTKTVFTLTKTANLKDLVDRVLVRIHNMKLHHNYQDKLISATPCSVGQGKKAAGDGAAPKTSKAPENDPVVVVSDSEDEAQGGAPTEPSGKQMSGKKSKLSDVAPNPNPPEQPPAKKVRKTNARHRADDWVDPDQAAKAAWWEARKDQIARGRKRMADYLARTGGAI